MKILSTAVKLSRAVMIAALVSVSFSSAIAQKRPIKSSPPDWETLKTAYNYTDW